MQSCPLRYRNIPRRLPSPTLLFSIFINADIRNIPYYSRMYDLFGHVHRVFLHFHSPRDVLVAHTHRMMYRGSRFSLERSLLVDGRGSRCAHR